MDVSRHVDPRTVRTYIRRADRYKDHAGARPARYGVMSEQIDPVKRDELFELYSELHLACGRAAAALRLASNWDAPEDELLSRFRDEEARAADIWRRIKKLRGE